MIISDQSDITMSALVRHRNMFVLYLAEEAAAAVLGDGDELETFEAEAELEAGEWCLLLPLAGQWAACPRQGELAPEQFL